MNIGETSPVAVLTEAKVLKLRQLLREGRTQKEVAAIIGVSKSAVKHVSKGRTWKHVPEQIDPERENKRLLDERDRLQLTCLLYTSDAADEAYDV